MDSLLHGYDIQFEYLYFFADILKKYNHYFRKKKSIRDEVINFDE